ncbi:MAG: hypothetical protein NTX75_08920, partial [Proteobacteria bacterium]|nr:hypothetical protein [Pseudomonadota bacterium]
DLVFEHENWPKRGLAAGPFQPIGRVPKKCSKSRLAKSSSGQLRGSPDVVQSNYPVLLYKNIGLLTKKARKLQ